MIDRLPQPLSDDARSRASYDKALDTLGCKVTLAIAGVPDRGDGPSADIGRLTSRSVCKRPVPMVAEAETMPTIGNHAARALCRVPSSERSPATRA
jgi:hypothetical protein